jgi:DNA ligase-1
MRDFAELFLQLDQTTKTNAKIEALVAYFASAPEADKLWAVALFAHRRPKRTVTTAQLRAWAAEAAGVPLWLFEASYHTVGDLAETIALLLPETPVTAPDGAGLADWIARIRALAPLDEARKKAVVLQAWQCLDARGRFLFNKIITGGFRVGVSDKIVVRALSRCTEQPENVVAHRLMGQWSPDTTTFAELLTGEQLADDASKPYPFCLAHPLDDLPENLGDPAQWLAEQKWDGIRGQLVVRRGGHYLWSRGEELITQKFPEYQALAEGLPDGTVLDGEILPWADGRPLPFSVLQTRIGRKTVSKKLLADAPCIFMAYDLLELDGRDFRARPLRERRAALEELGAALPPGLPFRLSGSVVFAEWAQLREARANARDQHSEGLMLKHLDSAYHTGRRRGDWWKWKVDALTVDAVMLYAQAGHGRRANLYTDYTFAVWHGEELVPFAKAYSGLTDAEIREVDAWIKKNTLERFGPVRSVRPELVMEIAFEGINASARHKSGIALRFPRIARWRKDKKIKDADTLASLKNLLDRKGAAET